MHASKIPVTKWVIALYLIITARKGISSLQLSKELGITQKSAWFMCQRIREEMQNEDMLAGIVEIDEAYFGGKESNNINTKKLKAGRGTIGKYAVIGMRERGGNTKAITVNNTDINTLQNCITDNVIARSTIYTDDHRSYIGLESHNEYKHGVVKHNVSEYVNGMVHTNSIESMWAVLKRSYHGIHHHISGKHLHRYVNKFSYRL